MNKGTNIIYGMAISAIVIMALAFTASTHYFNRVNEASSISFSPLTTTYKTTSTAKTTTISLSTTTLNSTTATTTICQGECNVNTSSEFHLSVSANPFELCQYLVNTNVSGYYLPGSRVNIIALSQAGCYFDNWTGTGIGSYTGTNNTTTITIHSNINEIANYKFR